MRECPVGNGNRLRSESLVVTLKGKTIADYVNLPISEAVVLFDALDLHDREAIIASRILKEIRDRLHFPRDFVGRGDMSRGGLLLRCIASGSELEYAVLSDDVQRHGVRPAKLPPLRTSVIAPGSSQSSPHASPPLPARTSGRFIRSTGKSRQGIEKME